MSLDHRSGMTNDCVHSPIVFQYVSALDGRRPEPAPQVDAAQESDMNDPVTFKVGLEHILAH